MSRYEDTRHECNRVCPYCGDSYQPEGEEYSEDTRVEECETCGKQYRAHDVFTVEHVAQPDCTLNGEHHSWQPARVGPGFKQCEECGQVTTGVAA